MSRNYNKLYMKYNKKVDKYTSMTIRGKIVKPDKCCQNKIPKSDFIVTTYRITRDTDNVTFIDVIDYLDNWLYHSDLNTEVEDFNITIESDEFLLISNNGIILKHSLDNKCVKIYAYVYNNSGNTKKVYLDEFYVPCTQQVARFFDTIRDEESFQDVYKFLLNIKNNKNLSNETKSALKLYRHFLTKNDFRDNSVPRVRIYRSQS